jgi:ligand-binding sensor domain-containing protein
VGCKIRSGGLLIRICLVAPKRSIAPVIFVACLVACFPSTSRPAQLTDSSAEFRVDVWKSEQGLPQNNVQCVLQTRDGYLWIGTYFGIARFDGVKFTVFDKANTPEMTSEAVPAMAEDLDGSLWIATRDGLMRRKDNTFTRYTTTDGLPENAIWLLCASSSGGVWIGTGHGLGRFEGGKFSCYTTADGLKTNDIRAICEDAHGTVFVGTAGGIHKFDPARRRFTDFTREFGMPDNRVAPLLDDRAGNFWAGTDNGLHLFRNGQWTTLTLADGLPQNSVACACKDRVGGLWLVTQNERSERFRDTKKLSHIHNGKITHVNISGTPDGLDVSCLTEDREGNLWLGTVGDGLVRLQPRRLKTYTTRDGLAHDNVWSVCEGTDGNIWVGTGSGLSRVQNGHVTSYTNASYPDYSSAIKSVWSDRAGNVWIPKPGVGLWLFNDGQFLDSPIATALGHTAETVYEDRTGAIWIGAGSEGIIRSKGDQTIRFGKANGLPKERVSAILEDHSGTLWFGTYGGGLCKFRDEKFTVFTTEHGLSNNRAWALYEDTEGALWIGTEHGLNRFKDGKFFVYTTKQGLFDNLVNHLLEDDFGNFWISCNRGIYRVSRNELNDVANGRATSVRYAAFGEADGMLSAETNGETQPAGWKARDGRLWFPTTKGLVVIDPKTIQDNDVPPPVVIEQVRADEAVIFGEGAATDARNLSTQFDSGKSKTRKLRLKAGSARVLEIQYTANSFVAPEKVRFKYRLQGHDTDWREAGDRRVAYYTALPPRQYQFHVKACNNHGYWNETGDTFAFYLAPHFYQTWGFYFLCGAVVIGAGLGLHFLRLNVVHKMQKLRTAADLANQRARFAQDMHDDIGANLTKIALLSEVARKNAHQPVIAELQSSKISTIAGEMVNNLSELIWAANPKFDTLENFVSYLREYVASYLEPTSIRWQLNFPTTVPPVGLTSEFRRNLFLVVKEALHNILKHSAATEVEVGLTVDNSKLALWITDNGRGFSTATLPRGDGLLNMRQRMTSIGGNFDLQSDSTKGTKIAFSVLLPS